MSLPDRTEPRGVRASAYQSARDAVRALGDWATAGDWEKARVAAERAGLCLIVYAADWCEDGERWPWRVVAVDVYDADQGWVDLHLCKPGPGGWRKRYVSMGTLGLDPELSLKSHGWREPVAAGGDA